MTNRNKSEKRELGAMGEYRCSQCDKLIYRNTTKSVGAVMCILSHSGTIVKNFACYGHPGFRIFCSKECQKAWVDSHLTDEDKTAGDRRACELRKSIEKSQKDICENLSRYVPAIKKGFEDIRDDRVKLEGNTKEEMMKNLRELFYQRIKDSKRNPNS